MGVVIRSNNPRKASWALCKIFFSSTSFFNCHWEPYPFREEHHRYWLDCFNQRGTDIWDITRSWAPEFIWQLPVAKKVPSLFFHFASYPMGLFSIKQVQAEFHYLMLERTNHSHCVFFLFEMWAELERGNFNRVLAIHIGFPCPMTCMSCNHACASWNEPIDSDTLLLIIDLGKLQKVLLSDSIIAFVVFQSSADQGRLKFFGTD